MPLHDRPPLPVVPLFVLCLCNFNEGLAGSIIFPLLPFLCARFGTSPPYIGTAVGFLAGAFFLGQVLTIAAWGRAADRWGRRPILLLGLAGTALSMVWLGLAASLPEAIAARLLCGMLSGNVAIAKVYCGEVTHAGTQARGFSWLSLTWGLSTIIAPAVGGWLASPADSWPGSPLDTPLLRAHPFLLPCLLSTAYGGGVLLLSIACLPETPAWSKRQQRALAEAAAAAAIAAALPVAVEEGGRDRGTSKATEALVAVTLEVVSKAEEEEEEEEGAPLLSGTAACAALQPALSGAAACAAVPLEPPLSPPPMTMAPSPPAIESADDATTLVSTSTTANPPPVVEASPPNHCGPPLEANSSPFTILSHPVVGRVIASYCALSSVQILFDELLAVFFSTPLSSGGLAWRVYEVGSVQVVQGVSQIICQLLIVPVLTARFGLIACYRTALLPLIPVLLAFPLTALFAPPPLSDFDATGGGGGGEATTTGTHPLLLLSALVFLLACKALLFTLTFTSIVVAINNAAPPHALGAVTGAAQMAASTVRALLPAAGGAIFSAAVAADALGRGRLLVPYGFMAALAACAWRLSFSLPPSCEAPPLSSSPRMGGQEVSGDDDPPL